MSQIRRLFFITSFFNNCDQGQQQNLKIDPLSTVVLNEQQLSAADVFVENIF